MSTQTGYCFWSSLRLLELIFHRPGRRWLSQISFACQESRRKLSWHLSCTVHRRQLKFFRDDHNHFCMSQIHLFYLIMQQHLTSHRSYFRLLQSYFTGTSLFKSEELNQRCFLLLVNLSCISDFCCLIQKCQFNLLWNQELN